MGPLRDLNQSDFATLLRLEICSAGNKTSMTWLRITYGTFPAEWKAGNPLTNVKGEDGQTVKGQYVIFDYDHEGEAEYSWVDENYDLLKFSPVLWERSVTAAEYMEGVENDDQHSRAAKHWQSYRRRR